jgi:hypothetical protein
MASPLRQPSINVCGNSGCLGKEWMFIAINEENKKKSSENVANFRCMGTSLTNQDCMYKKIHGSSNSRNACYHPVQKILSFCLPSENIKIKTYIL